MSRWRKKGPKLEMYNKALGKTILVFGSKGGCGNTFLTTCIANYFAMAETNILLIDMHPNKQDIRYIFRIDSSIMKNILDFEEVIEDMDLNVVKKVTINLETSLNIILSGNKMFNPSKYDCLLSFLKNYFDIIIIDYPLDLLEPSTLEKQLNQADKLIITTLLDMISLVNLKSMIDRMGSLGILEKTSLVANRASRISNVSSLNRLIRFPIDQFIPYDRDIESLFLSGKPHMIFKYEVRMIRSLRSYFHKIYSGLIGEDFE
jgi:cellulose biosynthesis protein BcsQ